MQKNSELEEGIRTHIQEMIPITNDDLDDLVRLIFISIRQHFGMKR